MQPGKNNRFFRDIPQFIAWLSPKLHSKRCIFKQVKTEQEARNEGLLARDEGGGTPTAR